MSERTAAEEQRERLQQFREIVANTVGFLRSAEISRSFTSIGLEELIDQRIERIEAPSGTRTGHLARLAKIKSDFDGAIEAIKETPVDAFRAPDPDTDANTPDNNEGTQ
jgi:hypothetical protein